MFGIVWGLMTPTFPTVRLADFPNGLDFGESLLREASPVRERSLAQSIASEMFSQFLRHAHLAIFG